MSTCMRPRRFERLALQLTENRAASIDFNSNVFVSNVFVLPTRSHRHHADTLRLLRRKFDVERTLRLEYGVLRGDVIDHGLLVDRACVADA